MANFHDTVLSIAGSHAAVNEAILLMAQNIADCTGEGSVERCDDPAESFSRYRMTIDQWYLVAFAGKATGDRYLSDTAIPSFVDNGEVCSFALWYACAWRLNENDLDMFLKALAERLGGSAHFSACVVHADECDNYNEVTIDYGCDGDWGMSDWCNKKDLRKERKACFKAGLDHFTDPDELARKHAVSLWSD